MRIIFETLRLQEMLSIEIKVVTRAYVGGVLYSPLLTVAWAERNIIVQSNMCFCLYLVLKWPSKVAEPHILNSRAKLTDRSKAVLLLWIIFVIYVSCSLCFLVCPLQSCSHLLRKG